jgi:outer membrane immunogenic protein
MKNFLLSGAALAAMLVGPAMAADMPVKARPVPVVAAYSWAGCYVGGTLGAVRGQSAFTWTGITESATAFATSAATALPAAANAHLRDTGITGGGEIGCNFQSGSFVYGVEGDLEYTGLSANRLATSLGLGNGGNPAIVPGAISESWKSSWLATLRGRAGFAVDRVFFYGTGGLALANARYFDQNCFGVLARVPGCNTAAISDARVGWVVGAGIEWAVGGNWSIKGEYLYADLGKTTDTSLYAPTAGGVNPFPQAFITHNHHLTENILRGGLNYRFSTP